LLYQELSRKDGADAVFSGPGLEPPASSSNAKATGTLKRPTSLSRHASAAGFPLSGSASWTLGRGYRSPLTVASPVELPTEGPSPDAVEDISNLLADVARFAEGLEKLKECVLRDGESQQGHTDRPGWKGEQDTDVVKKVEQGRKGYLKKLGMGLQGKLHELGHDI
jgi:hypothetical protein